MGQWIEPEKHEPPLHSALENIKIITLDFLELIERIRNRIFTQAHLTLSDLESKESPLYEFRPSSIQGLTEAIKEIKDEAVLTTALEDLRAYFIGKITELKGISPFNIIIEGIRLNFFESLMHVSRRLMEHKLRSFNFSIEQTAKREIYDLEQFQKQGVDQEWISKAIEHRRSLIRLSVEMQVLGCNESSVDYAAGKLTLLKLKPFPEKERQVRAEIKEIEKTRERIEEQKDPSTTELAEPTSALSSGQIAGRSPAHPQSPAGHPAALPPLTTPPYGLSGSPAPPKRTSRASRAKVRP